MHNQTDKIKNSSTKIVAIDVCPHCLTPVTSYAFLTRDEVRIETFTCMTHGDVVPRCGAVSNTPIPAHGPRTGTHPLAVYTPPDYNAELRRMALKMAQQMGMSA